MQQSGLQDSVCSLSLQAQGKESCSLEYRPRDVLLLSGPLPEGQEVKDRQDPSSLVSSQDHFALPQAQSCHSSAPINQIFPTRTFPIATIIYDNAVHRSPATKHSYHGDFLTPCCHAPKSFLQLPLHLLSLTLLMAMVCFLVRLCKTRSIERCLDI